jgi:hypothetical protein
MNGFDFELVDGQLILTSFPGNLPTHRIVQGSTASKQMTEHLKKSTIVAMVDNPDAFQIPHSVRCHPQFKY